MLRKLTSAVFYLVLFELVLGGGGRLTAVGPISLRMILFGVALILSAFHLVREKTFDRQLALLLGLFAGMIGIGVTVGVVSGSEKDLIWEDVKPLLYVFMLPFFYFAVRDDRTIANTIQIIKGGSLALALLFILCLILIHSGAIPFLTFYNKVIDTQEFFFRGEITFFYKGFLYLCLGLIVVFFLQQKYRAFFAGFLIFAILLTLTRGFIFALSLTYLAYLFWSGNQVRSALLAVCVVVFVLFSKPAYQQLGKWIDRYFINTEEELVPRENILGNRDLSDAGRIEQLDEVLHRVTLKSTIVGHGFGNGIPQRPIHMEISYAEIFHKQGILGLAVWFFLLTRAWHFFRQGELSHERKAFFYGILFIYFQSITNQFINNPIGLAFILIALIVLKKTSGKTWTGQNEIVTKKVMHFHD